MFDAIRDQLQKAVPFASTVGVEILEVGPGTARVALDPRPALVNHLGALHAGALFTLGEAASGAAMTGAFAAEILSLRAVTAESTVRYLKLAKSRVEARATTGEPAAALNVKLRADGSLRFPVTVDIFDDAGAAIAVMQFDWHVKRLDRQG